MEGGKEEEGEVAGGKKREKWARIPICRQIRQLRLRKYSP
jgi:hypothetical protein